MAAQVGRERRLVVEITSVVAEPEVRRDRPVLPLEPGEAEPPGVGGFVDEPTIELAMPWFQEQARGRRRAPPLDVLREEPVQMAEDVAAGAHLLHREGPGAIQEALGPAKLLLA